MPNRIIKESIRTSKNVNSLTDFQFRVWMYLITYVDDFGRGSADPELLKGIVFPRRRSVTETQIREALLVLANNGMITLYDADEEPYFYFPKWSAHQRIQQKKSKYPAPPDSTVVHGEAPSESKKNPESESEAKESVAREEDDGFTAFWEAFPQTTGDIREAYTEYLGALQEGIAPETLLEAVRWQAEKKGRYMPSAAKWLRNKGWKERRPSEPAGTSQGSGKTKSFVEVYRERRQHA